MVLLEPASDPAGTVVMTIWMLSETTIEEGKGYVAVFEKLGYSPHLDRLRSRIVRSHGKPHKARGSEGIRNGSKDGRHLNIQATSIILLRNCPTGQILLQVSQTNLLRPFPQPSLYPGRCCSWATLVTLIACINPRLPTPICPADGPVLST